MAWIGTAITAAIVGGALGTAAAGINSLVNGVYPWEDPLGYLKADLKGGAIGAASGAVTSGIGSAIGPMLGQAADAVGIGANTGTAAAQAGAATPQALGGAISKAGGSFLTDVGTNAGGGILEHGLTSLKDAVGPEIAGLPSAPAAAPATLGPLGQVAKSAVLGAATGAAGDPRDPLRGALSGTAMGVASSGLQQGVGALMRGQTGGTFFNTTPVKTFDFKYNPDAEPYSLARGELLKAPSYGIQPTMNGPGLGGRAITGATGVGSRVLGGAAQMGVRSALTPRPIVPETLPWGQQPYWQRPYMQ